MGAWGLGGTEGAWVPAWVRQRCVWNLSKRGNLGQHVCAL